MSTSEINTQKWKWFRLIDLFDIKGTSKWIPSEMDAPGLYPHVSSKATNNGVMGFYDYYTEEGGVLTVESSVNGYCAYQKENFSSHGHIIKLIPKFEMNDRIALFLVTIINLDREYFDYGRKCTLEKLEKRVIKLPVQKKIDYKHTYSEQGYVPDWEYMNNLMNELFTGKIKCRNNMSVIFSWENGDEQAK